MRDGAHIEAYVDGKKAVETTVEDEEILRNLNDNPRFKFYGWRAGRYEISNAVLTDGAE